MDNETKIIDWISVSTLAAKLGVSNQTVYNRIRSGQYKAHKYKRGKLSGILVDINSVKQ